MSLPFLPDVLPSASADAGAALDDAAVATLSALEDALDGMRERGCDVPQWEYCEGFLTALLCMRRAMPQSEWLPVLLADKEGKEPFVSEAERTHFLMHWLAREAQVRTALQAQVNDLQDERALQPGVLDWRGMAQALADESRAPPATADAEAGSAAAISAGQPASRADEVDALALHASPAYAQLWAMGFVCVTELWPDDWVPPRDKAIAASMLDALECVADLMADDTGTAAFNAFEESAPPSISEQRLEAFGEAIWAVYDLYAIARSLGPRVAPVRHADKVGRNHLCTCGSGRKYKKCCGA